MRALTLGKWLVSTLCWVTMSAFAQTCTVEKPIEPDNWFPQIRLETSSGVVVVELDRRRAPVTANNFLHYVTSGSYDGTVFHRVVADFVVQGGGYDLDGNERPEIDPIINESGNGLRNAQGSIAMARFDDPHSATSQFYFNLKDNDSLDPSSRRWGYTVFGYIIEGAEVVEAIGKVATHADERPQVPVILERAVLVKPDA